MEMGNAKPKIEVKDTEHLKKQMKKRDVRHLKKLLKLIG